ncbi:MAG: hypothetical protein R2754_05685 [Microthrixaceae bacterium]
MPQLNAADSRPAASPLREPTPRWVLRLRDGVVRARTRLVEPVRGLAPPWARLQLMMVILVGVVVVWPVLWGGLPEGDDVPYHVAKNAFAFSNIFGAGHLNGWAPTFSMGSEQFLLYGPGLAALASAMRVLTLGAVGHESLVAWSGALGLVATAPAAYFLARGLRLGPTGSATVGVASLCVSVPFGVGAAGTFDLGLIPHQLATPLVLLTLGALVRAVDLEERRWVTLASVAAVAVTVTHLTSALVTAVAFGIVLGLRAATPSAGRPAGGWAAAAYRVFLAGALAAGFGAWWIVPLLENSGPRPPTATWTTQPLGAEVRDLLTTHLWASTAIVVATVAALGMCLVWWMSASAPLARLAPWRAAVVLAGPVLLLVLYALHQLLPGDTALLVVNRGTGYAALLWILPLGVVADAAANGRPPAFGLALVAVVGLAVAAAPSLIPHREDIRPASPPSPELTQVGGLLEQRVPPEGRFAWVHEDGFDQSFGPVHPDLWLAMEAQVSTLNGFGGETISPVDTFVQYQLAAMDPREADPLLVRNGVTHLVAGPSVAARYDSLPGWEVAWSSPRLVLLERRADVSLAAPRVGQQTTLEAWEPERVSWRSRGGDAVVLGLPAFPKWRVTVDGERVTTSDTDGFLTVPLSGDGEHVVEARFVPSWGDRLGLLIALIAIAGRTGLLGRVRRGAGAARRRFVGGGTEDVGGGTEDGDQRG